MVGQMQLHLDPEGTEGISTHCLVKTRIRSPFKDYAGEYALSNRDTVTRGPVGSLFIALLEADINNKEYMVKEFYPVWGISGFVGLYKPLEGISDLPNDDLTQEFVDDTYRGLWEGTRGLLLERQQEMREFVDQVLLYDKDLSNKGISLVHRYHELTYNGKPSIAGINERLKNVSISFLTYEDKIDVSCFVTYSSHDLVSLCYLEIMERIKHNRSVSKCAYCGQFFSPEGRIDARYCNRVQNKYGQTCREVGPMRLYTSNLADNPLETAYRNGYKKYHYKMTKEEFVKWKEEALRKKEAVKKGRLTLEDFQRWIKGK